MDAVSSTIDCIEADTAKCFGAGHGTQALTPIYKCVPDCTCEVCRPDLDLESLCADGRVLDIDGMVYVRYVRDLLEVFSVKFPDLIGVGGRVRGNMTIPLVYDDYQLFGPNAAEDSYIEIDQNGNAELRDANCWLDVADPLYIFFEFQRGDDETSSKTIIKECVGNIWNPFTEPVHKTLCKQLETKMGPVEVTLAIVQDALPARVEVCLLDWPLDQDTALVDGYIFVRNKDISNRNALSFLFRKPPKSSSVVLSYPLEEGSGIPLPLSKHSTSASRDSALQVYVQLKQRFKKGFRWIAQDMLEFSAKPGDSECQIINGNYFKLGVSVTWSQDEMITFEERTKIFAEMLAAVRTTVFMLVWNCLMQMAVGQLIICD